MKRILLILGVSVAIAAGAQQDAQLTQYMFNGVVYNPGYVGTHDYGQLNLVHRSQWTGFEGAPQSSLLSFDYPFKSNNMGVGATIAMDKIGVTKTFTFSGNYAYHIKLNNTSKLSFGVKAGLMSYSADLQSLQYWNSDDEVFNQNISGEILPEFGFGMYWYSDKYYAGISMPRLFEINSDNALNIGNLNSPELNRHYFLTAGYVLTINDQLDMRPSFMIKYVAGAPVSWELSDMVLINKVFWIGASYRHGDCISAIAQYTIGKLFSAGYSYDYTVSNLRSYSGGSHEFMVSYLIGADNRQESPLYF